MKKLLMLAALAALFVGSAWSEDQVKDGQKFNRTGASVQSLPTPSLIGGVVRTDTSSKALTLDANGKLIVSDTDRDRDYSTPIQMFGTLGSTLAAGTSATTANAYAVGEYTSLTINVSWNCAAADTDSVAIGITFIGKVSSEVNDGFDYVVGMADTASFDRPDSLVFAYNVTVWKPHTVYIIPRGLPNALSTGGATPYGRNPGIYHLSPSAAYAANTRHHAWRVPASRTIWSDGRMGVAFVLHDLGAPFKFSHLMCLVQNLSKDETITNLKVDLWPKVN